MSTTPVLGRSLLARIEAARACTDELFQLLNPDALYSRPIPERHRLIFYLGHLEAFDWNQICRQALDLPSFHPEFDRLFEFGIDPPIGRAAGDQPSDWPSEREVLAYGQRTREIIDNVLERAPAQIINVALEHRWMHAETFAYLLHNLPYDQKAGPPPDCKHYTRPLQTAMIQIPEGRATLGQRRGEFGWDNEFDQHQISVARFAISRYKVTNGDCLNFVQDGGQPPHFWTRRSGNWFYRGMFAEIPLPLNAPAYVTHAEASAYAKWRGGALPTETQFHRAAYGTPWGEERSHPWGFDTPSPARGNFDFHHWDPTDVDANPAGDSAFGVSQLVGNGWEWTSTLFGPFPGFEPFPFYPGYSKNFFDQEHYVMKGGSPRTAQCLLRRSFRNWFRPDYPYVYASFRLVQN